MEYIFYFLSSVLLFSALRVITSKNPVYSALFLVLSFFSAAGIWLLLQAEFLAIALVLVYVGAVMVLFLFVIMMLDINLDHMKKGFWDYLPAASFVAIIMLIEMILVLNKSYFESLNLFVAPEISNTDALGSVLYSDYILPFEIAAIILLVAIISAITLTLRKTKINKNMNPADQVKVKRNNRIKMINIRSESRLKKVKKT